MRKRLKPGDRVRFIGNYPSYEGRTGTVLWKCIRDWWKVWFDGDDGYHTWVRKDLELVEEPCDGNG